MSVIRQSKSQNVIAEDLITWQFLKMISPAGLSIVSDTSNVWYPLYPDIPNPI